VSGAGRQRASLRTTGHRPFPLPERPWFGGQTWEHLAFAHWAVDPERLAQLIPPGLELDVRDGQAWIAVTPFLLTGLRPRFLPAVPGLSRFLETNVRTYVRRGGRGGIYFFSLDATNPLAVQGARRLNDLPYRRAQGRMRRSGRSIRYVIRRSDARFPPAWLAARYAAHGRADTAQPGSLEEFLVERYCLFAVREAGEIVRTDIHHAPWRVHSAVGELQQRDLIPPELGPLAGPPLLHVARRQDVLVWRPVRA
jgi:uncharacterized protein YqjF (DUF2071 family)